ncbi:hypothetical protein VD0002_g1286 [Verticillium dahliae]|uniref:Epoxide hydrolase N-terminal domain-containing protein n=1 Tax=Verticillium dahliae TaxID=27337 RepID=A0AA44WKN2_VERDA|nr:Alpha/Beta hydrolase protein [Verticillium dahliae]PNH33274.1 hypothetical protein BJF96_g3594 [Verticillium dahliae]PNH54884.1 hypothetical protein VD0003_g2662 [Verticillium dahliae]PNH68888.1 hypothetical protein VD0002_g1286 [Verticillium dahliae]
MSDIVPFTINVPDALLEETRVKLKYARLDDAMGSVEWNDLEIGHKAFKELVQFWRDEYDWKNYESFLNTFHHFKTTIQVPGFEALGIHFLHHRSSRPDAVPLLFLHGWPGSFLEVLKILPLLTEPEEGKPAFHVVAPSLPGFGFSDFSKKKGFGIDQHATCFAMLMERLGYNEYVCQGGDWGSIITRFMALKYPKAVRAIHINMLLALPPDPKKSPQKYARYQKKDYDERDLKNMERTNWFAAHERGYQRLQETKCVTLGYGLHDSPVAILAWFVGKLKTWTDDYPWTKEELINWTFMHYQGSPSAAMQIYKEALAVLNNDPDSMVKRYVTQPVGGSVFPKEIWMSPREWMEETYNIQFWRQKDGGGHFAAWEQPEALVNDLRDFFGADGPAFGKH